MYIIFYNIFILIMVKSSWKLFLVITILKVWAIFIFLFLAEIMVFEGLVEKILSRTLSEYI